MFKGLFTPDNIVCEWVMREKDIPQEIREVIHGELRFLVLDEIFGNMRTWSRDQRRAWEEIVTTRNPTILIGMEKRAGKTTLCEGLIRIGLMFGMRIHYHASNKLLAQRMIMHLKESLDPLTFVQSNKEEIRLANGASILCTPLMGYRQYAAAVNIVDVIDELPPQKMFDCKQIIWLCCV